MKRKLIAAAFLFVFTASVALGGLFKSESAIANANPEATVASPVAGVCDFSFIKNVKVRDLGRRDFEVTWEFSTSDPCLQAQSFVVEVRAKRRIGGALLGKEVLTVGGGERRVIAKFRSLAGFDKVEATVTASITIKPFSQTFVDL